MLIQQKGVNSEIKVQSYKTNPQFESVLYDNEKGKAQTVEQKITQEKEIAKKFKAYVKINNWTPDTDIPSDMLPSKLFDLKCKYYEKN